MTKKPGKPPVKQLCQKCQADILTGRHYRRTFEFNYTKKKWEMTELKELTENKEKES